MKIKSPLNYTGNKFKIYDSIEKLLPNNSNLIFVDVFGGSFTVGMNTTYSKVVYNDKNVRVKEIVQLFVLEESEIFIKKITDLINKYELSKENTDGYLKLRNDYNITNNPYLLYTLSCYSFNHQLRFNSGGSFNTPFGKNRSHFSKNMRMNLINFNLKSKKKNIKFYSIDFEILVDKYLNNDNAIFYFDPPYLITCGSYNDGKRGEDFWDEVEEIRLLRVLDKIADQGGVFFLSNVLVHKGKKNSILLEWSKDYFVHKIENNYSNSSYQTSGSSQEVIITNYKEKL